MKQIDIQLSGCGYGHFLITTTYRGKQYSTVTTNTLAIDRYRNTDVSDNEIKRINNL